MHLIHCLTHSSLGGGQEVVYTLLRALQEISPEMKLTVILPAGGVYGGRFKAAEVEIVEFPFDRLSSSSLVRFRSLMRSLDPDLLHSHGKGAGFYARALPHLRAQRIHSYHGFHPPAQAVRRRLYLSLESLLLRRTGRVIGVSESESAEVGSVFGYPAEKIETIPNIVDREKVLAARSCPLSSEAEAFFRAHGNALVAIMIGRDDPVKNLPLAVESARLVLSHHEKTVFIFVGISTPNERLRTLAAAYPGRVLALPPVENVSPYLDKSDVLFMTSRKEGCPLTVLEAYCLGKPVVATRVPGIKDVVVDGADGMLCDERPAALAAAIGSLAADRAAYESFAARAHARGVGMNVRSWASRYADVYATLVH